MKADDKRRGKGFALMDEQQRKEVASLGGKASQLSGKGHIFTSEEARAAGRRMQQLRKLKLQTGGQP